MIVFFNVPIIYNIQGGSDIVKSYLFMIAT